MFCTVSLPRKWSIRKIWSSRQYRVQLLVERERALEVGTERLLDHEPAKAVGLVGETGLRDLLRGVGEHARRQREVEDRGTVELRRSALRSDSIEMSPPWNSMRSMNRSKYFWSTSTPFMSIAARRFSWNWSVVHSWRAYPMILQILEPLAVLEREQRREQQPSGEISGCAEHDERRLAAHAFLLEFTGTHPHRSRPDGDATRRARLTIAPMAVPSARPPMTSSGKMRPDIDAYDGDEHDRGPRDAPARTWQVGSDARDERGSGRRVPGRVPEAGHARARAPRRRATGRAGGPGRTMSRRKCAARAPASPERIADSAILRCAEREREPRRPTPPRASCRAA